MSDCWSVLGLARTPDQRAIKKAYAARLKAIDPDRDPEAFLALREAFDHARWDARYGDDDDEFFSDDGDFNAVEPEQILAHDGLHPEPAEPEPATALPVPEDDTPPDFQQQLSALLWSDTPLTAQDQALMVTLLQLMVSDPRNEQVDQAGELEDWLAWAIMATIPRSDALIPHAVQHFGWDKQAGSIATRYGVAEVLQREKDIPLFEELKNPAHQWHAVHSLLSQPVSDETMKQARPKQVLGYLDLIRTHHPTIEWGLDRDHVERWDGVLQGEWEKRAAEAAQPPEEKKGAPWWWVLFILAPFLSICSRAISDDKEPVQPPPAIEQLAEPPITEPDILLWRVDQAPRIAAWMKEHRLAVQGIVDIQAVKGGGLPDCEALNDIVAMRAAEIAQCRRAEQRRLSLRQTQDIAEKAAMDAQALGNLTRQ